MNKIKFLALIFLILTDHSYSQNQEWIFGANTNYNIPVAGLSDRLEGSLGGLVFAGMRENSNWTWLGKFEYFKLTDVNRDKMFKVIQAEVGGTTGEYKFELPLLKMDLTVAGLGLEARYRIFSSDFFETDLNFGFGFYFWEHFRGGYNDSLFVDSTGRGDLILVEVLDIPALRQKDWSGGINIGADFNFILSDPLSFNLGFNYKIIIGELWPALALNLENVSGMQFMDLRAGIRVKL